MKQNKSIDEAYVKKFYARHRGSVREGSLQKILEAMRAYGDNHWWESEDPYVVVKHQVHEKVLLVPNMGFFVDCIETVLGRPFESYEFGTNPDIKKTIDYAIERYERGHPLTQEESVRDYLESIGYTIQFFEEKEKGYQVVDDDGEPVPKEEIDLLLEELVKKEN